MQWSFTRRGLAEPKQLASKYLNEEFVKKNDSGLTDFEIEEYAACTILVLKNVNESYNGIYTFQVQGQELLEEFDFSITGIF